MCCCFKPQHEHSIYSAKLVRFITITVSRPALGKIHLLNIIPIRSDQPLNSVKDITKLSSQILHLLSTTTLHLLHHFKI
jgi:hypothetical protein